MYKLKHLQNDSKWKPAKGLWFRKYVYKIELLPNSEQSVSVEKPHRQKQQYKFNPETQEYDVYNTIYTEDTDFLVLLLNNFDYSAVYTPINEEHERLLKTSKDNKIIIRDSLYYKKYRYRVEVIENWRNRVANQESLLRECYEFIKKTFDKESSKYKHSYGFYRYSLPFIYTNDLHSVMLLKLAYNESLRIMVSEVTTYDDLK